jgi:hypothetical protein
MFTFREPLKSNPPSSKVRINGDFAFTPLERSCRLCLQSNLVTDRLRREKFTLISGKEVAFQSSGSMQIKVILVDTGDGKSQEEQLKALFWEGNSQNQAG